MAINLQKFTEKLTKQLDEVHVADLCTGFLAGGSLEAEFASADTVLIPEYDMSGLGDYSRQSGFPKGSIAMRKKAYTLPMERGRSFSVDIRDLKTNDIKDAVGSLGTAMNKFQKTKVNPEVDAFNLSTIAASAAMIHARGAYSSSSTDIVKNLIYDIDEASERANGEELFVMLNWGVHGFLSASTEFTKRLDVANFKKGAIDTQLKVINDAGIVKVPRERMKTAYTYFNGVDTDQKNGGFAPTSTAKSINWIILPRSAANCITCLEKSQIINPENNNDGMMYKQGYRRLFGAFVREGEKDRVLVCKES